MFITSFGNAYRQTIDARIEQAHRRSLLHAVLRDMRSREDAPCTTESPRPYTGVRRGTTAAPPEGAA